MDGLNKNIEAWDLQYYLHELRHICVAQDAPLLAYPDRGYFTQIARFDPSKGIPDVIRSYAKYRDMVKGKPQSQSHQLIICGHSSVDDPNASIIFDQTIKQIEDEVPGLKDDIVVLRTGPSDQMLNAILSMATVALQLSTREGFEVKLSEALHKVRPMMSVHFR